jgi:hypothetical protein
MGERGDGPHAPRRAGIPRAVSADDAARLETLWAGEFDAEYTERTRATSGLLPCAEAWGDVTSWLFEQ